MRAVTHLAVLIGLLSLVLGVIDHFLILGGKGATLELLASPAAFLQFAIAMFLLALVLLVSQLVYRTPCSQPESRESESS